MVTVLAESGWLFGSVDIELDATLWWESVTDLVTEPVTIAKSNIILDVKPWDDETDMAKLEECVRSIEMDGLLWGACKLQMTGHVDMFLFVNLICSVVILLTL